jgi:tRNA(fMet)-specific endonuclease VapC
MYLLDTNILSELVKKKPARGLLEKLKETEPEMLVTSSVTVMEMRFGAISRQDGRQFWKKLQEEIFSRVSILGFHEREAVICGDLLSELARKGTPIGMEDAMIGSIALANHCTVVTANTRHFERIPGLKVENWLDWKVNGET